MMRATHSNRGGVTLSEILISMMVMSIGIVSLATLFPISILRSIQATQLTNATIHRLNAEELISLFPRLVHDPNGNTDFSEHELGGVDKGRFIVDPLGFNNSVLSGPPDVHAFFGNHNGAPPPFMSPIRRYDGATAAISNITATKLGYSPDTWQLHAKGIAPILNVGTNSIDVAASVDTQTVQSTLTNLGTGSVRLVLFSENGKSSVNRLVTSVVGNTISWDDPASAADDLPVAGYTSIQRFRLEFSDPRYSWLLTVRKSPSAIYPAGDAKVDVAVFHNRAFSAASEQVFFLRHDPPPYDNGVGPGESSLTLDLTYTTPQKPFLKRGGYLFDVQNAYWYRIVQFTDDLNYPVITVDRPIISQINSQVGGNRVPAIMAMPGIVEVFPIGTVPYNPYNKP